MKEVRWEYLKGRDAAERLRRKPVAYLPIGALERHGNHLPMGLDALKAHAICCECAQRIGGVVFPAHHYAGIQQPLAPEADRATRRRVRDRQRQLVQEWRNLYTENTCEATLFEILNEIGKMGARVLVLYSGHYPVAQRQMIRRLAGRFNRRKPPSMRVIPFEERTFFGEGDHAGLWETSLFLAVCPEMVDMDRIGPRDFADHHWQPAHDPRRATADFGRRAVRKIVRELRSQITERLDTTSVQE